MRKAVPSAQIVTFETSPQAFVALQQRKASGFINDEISLYDAFTKLGASQKDYVILTENISTERIALGIRKGEAGMKALVDQVLRQFEASGEAEKLFLKWCGPGTRLAYPKRTFKIDSDRVDP
jgi:polar amino acid transport system substrate-binding protein